MSTSLLYHGWGLRGYQYRRTDYGEGGIVFTIEPQPHQLRCGHCGGDRVMRRAGSAAASAPHPSAANRCLAARLWQRLTSVQ